jgi:hypothetical protein
MGQAPKLFLDGIFDSENRSPSSVTMYFPVLSGDGSVQSSITGLMTSETSVSGSNKWGPILSDITNIQDIASLLGESHMWSWIGASTMCWKGTDPIKTSVEFYLINYKEGLRLEEKLKEANKLVSLYNINKNVAVKVHGGYKAKVLETNQTYFSNGSNKFSSSEILDRAEIANIASDAINMEEGTCTLCIGNKMRLRKLLVQRFDVQPSLVELPDGKALYYRVNVSFIGTSPLLDTDVNFMYGRF